MSQAATECLAGLPAEEEGDREDTDPTHREIKGLGCCTMAGYSKRDREGAGGW